MTNIILDTSALMVLIKDESGANTLEALLGQIVTSSLCVSEMAELLLDSDMTIYECQQALQPLISNIIPFDQEQAFRVAALTKQLSGQKLSLSTRACLALSSNLQIPIYTADEQLSHCLTDNCQIVLIG